MIKILSLNLNSLLVYSDNPKKLADFYTKVFGKKADMDDGDYKGFLVGNCFITFGKHDKIKGKNKSPERIMINFEAKDVRREFIRIEKLGAKVIAKPYTMGDDDYWIATFADPDGNYFQLMTPWKPK